MVLSHAQKSQRARNLRRYAIGTWTVRMLALATALAVVGLVLWWEHGRAFDPIRRRAIADLCNAQYKHAVSAADTARIDLEQPVIDRLSAVARVSCGDLRRSPAVVP
jgi:hypothetical protein